MIRRFDQVFGRYIEKIPGQERFAFALSDQEDFYDQIEWAKRGGYQGAVIRFYDLSCGTVFTPFPKKRDVLYSTPVYAENVFWFLQGDFETGKIRLIRYLPGEEPETAAEFPVNEVELYNLQIVGEKVHVISQKDEFRCYYPKSFSFPLSPNETVCFIEDGKVFLEAWIEEGWDEAHDCATDTYEFYHQVIVKNEEGQTLSMERGSLFQAPDGTWWIA